MATAYEVADDRQSDEGPDGNMTHTRKFVVDTGSAVLDGISVLSAVGLPPRYSQHPSDAGALLIRRRPVQHSDSQTHWFVTCEYSTDLTRATGGISASGGTGEGGAPEATDDPLQEPPDITFSAVRYQEALELDWDGQLIQNAAWEKFDPPLTTDWAYLALDVQRNLPRFDPLVISTHLYAINIDPYLGFQQDEVLLDDLKAKPRWGKGKFYWDVSARFIFNPKEKIPKPGGGEVEVGGWYKVLLNAGFQKRSGSTVTRIVLSDGSYPSRPQLLDNNGAVLAAGAAPLFGKFRVHRRKSLQVLGII